MKGGHFLSQDVLDFDNGFFRLNAEVAAVRSIGGITTITDFLVLGNRSTVATAA